MSGQVQPRSHAKRNAWLSLLGFPVAFVLAVLTGMAIASVFLGLGEQEILQPQFVPLVLIPVVLIVAIPAVFAYRFGRKAAAEGASRPMLPAWIAIGLVALFVLVNIADYLAAVLTPSP